VPRPVPSPRIDAIKKAGVLRVGVLANAPWLVENTSGQGEAWSGPAWLLAQGVREAAQREARGDPVSHETKVPVLASNQVDISVTPLAGDARSPEGRRLRHLLDHQRVHVRACRRIPKFAGREERSTTSTGRTSPSRITPAAARRAG
jgi:hypothetical protein